MKYLRILRVRSYSEEDNVNGEILVDKNLSDVSQERTLKGMKNFMDCQRVIEDWLADD